MSKTLNYTFPYQQRTLDQKTPTFFKECADTALEYIDIDYHGIRSSYNQKVRNYNLMNDIFDFSDLKEQLVPLLGKNDKYPIEVQHYPKIPQKINLLVGEDLNRKFNFTAKVTNDDAISSKEKEIDDDLDAFFIKQLQSKIEDPKQLEKAIKEHKNYLDYNFQDKHERMANQILRYYWTYLDMKEIFNRGLEDLLVASEELYRCDILGNEPILTRVNPLNLKVIGGNNSPWLQDAQIIIQDEYWNISSILDAYYDVLTPTQIKKIERGLQDTSDSNGSRSGFESQPEFYVIDDLIDVDVNSHLGTTNGSNQNYQSVNENGDVRVSRVVWKGMKKVGILSFFDQTTGELEQEMVHEKYEIDESKGEVSIQYIWVGETLETTRIGNKDDGFHIKMQRLPVESRRLDNQSKCTMGYVGLYFNINDNKAMSLVDRLYEYQRVYNLYMNKLNFLFMKYKGPVYKMDFSTMPDGYSVEEWLYYADVLGWELSNPFNEGNKGAAQGKLAGLMNQNQGVKEANLYSIIQQTIDMLNYLEAQIDSISGISKPREGSTSSGDAVTNVTRDIQQSAHSTQKWFSLHDQVKREALSLFLETAKVAFKGRSKKAQHILDDGTIEIINIDGDLLNEAQYDIQIVDTTEIQQLFQDLKQLGHAALQNDKITISQLISLYMTNSIADVKNKLEQGEKEKVERDAEQRDHEKQLLEMQTQAAELAKEKDNEFELLKQANDIQAKILLAQVDLNSNENITDKDRQLEEKLGLLSLKLEEMKVKAIEKTKTTSK